MARSFIQNDRVCISTAIGSDFNAPLDQRDANAYGIFRMVVAVIKPSHGIKIAIRFNLIERAVLIIQAP